MKVQDNRCDLGVDQRTMAKHECDGKDYLHMGPQVEADGSRACLRHMPDHTWREGILRPVKEGQPLRSDLPCVAVERQEDGTFSVQELMPGSRTEEAATSSGPAMVNSENFKTGWDRVFGKATVGVA